MNYSMLIKLTSPSSIVHVLAHAAKYNRHVGRCDREPSTIPANCILHCQDYQGNLFIAN